MMYTILAVWDSAVQGYARPMYMQSKGQGIRSFIDEVKREDKDNPLNKHPEDYELHFLGEWSDWDGRYKPEEPPTCIARGKDAQ